MSQKNIQEAVETIVVNNPLVIKQNADSKTVDFYLTGEVSWVSEYIDFLRAIDDCKSGDQIQIHINNYGGYIDTALNIYDALVKSEADVLIFIEGACASAASIIMLAGNGWEVLPHAYVMVHSWSGSYGGKWHEIKSKLKYDEEVFNKQFCEIYKKFMTDEEIKQCLDGKDFYFDSEETVKRLEEYSKESLEKEKAIQTITKKYEEIIKKEIQQVINKKVPITKKSKKGDK